MQNRLFQEEQKKATDNDVSLNQVQKDFFNFAIKKINEDIESMKQSRFHMAPELKEQIKRYDFAISCHEKRVQGLKKILNGERITQADADLLLKMEVFNGYRLLITSSIETTHVEKPKP